MASGGSSARRGRGRGGFDTRGGRGGMNMNSGRGGRGGFARSALSSTSSRQNQYRPASPSESSESAPSHSSSSESEIVDIIQPPPKTTWQHPTSTASSSASIPKLATFEFTIPIPRKFRDVSELSQPTNPKVISPTTPALPTSSASNPEDNELVLLDGDAPHELAHEVVTAPLVTRDAYLFGEGLRSSIPQYGILGSIVSIHSQSTVDSHEDPRIYLNTNAPFSAVVCGVQGSGKSHTVGVLLESMMIPDDTRLGALTKPLAGLVLHYGENGGSQPCEAAYQCLTADPKIRPPVVKVHVSPSRIGTMTQVYSAVFGKRVEVIPLKFAHSELDAQAFLSMMCVSTGKEPPLYVQVILSILREMGDTFTYLGFQSVLEEKKSNGEFNLAQLAGIKQRMNLLETFLGSKRIVAPRFANGQITIVDLTDPFIDPASACSIFEIVTRLFVRADVGTGKVLIVDEAHKYLTMGSGSTDLTRTLLSIVRQQRHLGMRMILSTQEPTVIPSVLLDLCTITIMHRFSSIGWFDHLSKHVSSQFTSEAFDTLVRLQTGQAIVLAPAGLGVFKKGGEADTKRHVASFGRRWLVVKTRRRLTKDGGASILVV
ncbi:hypothetical protein FRB96_001858 [Tulasnella sp. 330]|nr:hypothetical protein FRB96_001858 [Tulasnella sp. 330]